MGLYLVPGCPNFSKIVVNMKFFQRETISAKHNSNGILINNYWQKHNINILGPHVTSWSETT